MTLAAFLSLWAIQLAAVMIPGPAFVVCLRTAASEGFRPAAAVALGLGLGVAMWTLVTMTGLSVLFAVAPWLLAAFKVGLLPPGTPLWQRAMLVAVFFADEFLWNLAVARVFSLGPARSAYGRLKAWIDRAFGAVLALLGAKIALA